MVLFQAMSGSKFVSSLLVFLLGITLVVPQNGRVHRSVDTGEARARLDDYRLPRAVLPAGYALELIPYPGEGHYRGRVKVNLTCQQSTHTIILHAHPHLRIVHQAVTVRRLPGPYDRNQVTENDEPQPISSITRDTSKERVSVTLLEELEKGIAYQLEMEFYGALDSENAQGFFRSSYGDESNKRWFAATKMAPTNARRVFPCFDEPSFKASFQISVARFSSMSSLSNMPLQSIELSNEEKGWVWDHFPPTPPISPFSVGVLVSELKSHNPVIMPSPSGGVAVHFHGREEFLSSLHGVLRIAPQMMIFLEDYLGIRYPLPKLDIVALPKFPGRQPADHLGLILFQEAELADLAGQSRLVHELAHQWLTHIVTPYWWNDLHITNALGRFLATKGLLHLIERENWGTTLQHSLYYEYSSRKPYSTTPSFRSESLTARAEWLLKMLCSTLSESTFKTSLTNFLLNNQYSTYNSEEFWATLDHQAVVDGMLHRPIRVGHIAQSWLRKDCHRFPVLTVTRNYEDNSATLEQHVFLREQPRVLSEEEAELLWWIPIEFLTPDKLDLSPAAWQPVDWMQEEKYLNLSGLPDPSDFIIINPTDSGMFLVNYDHHNWELLVEFLQRQSDGSSLLPVATRIKLLHDAWLLALGEELHFGTALDMSLFLANETEPAVWDTFFTVIEQVSWHIRGTSIYRHFNEYLQQLLAPMYKRLQHMDGYEMDSEFLFNAHALLCGTGYEPCIAEMQEALAKILPTVATIEDSNYMYNETETAEEEEKEDEEQGPLCFELSVVWNTTLEQEETIWAEPILQFISFLADRTPSERMFILDSLDLCSDYTAVVEKILDESLDTENNFTDTEWQQLINFVSGSNTGHSLLFKYLTENFRTLQNRFSENAETWHHLLQAAITRFRTQDGLDKVSSWYAANGHWLGHDGKMLVENAMDFVNEEIAWGRDNLPDIEHWLQRMLPHLPTMAD